MALLKRRSSVAAAGISQTRPAARATNARPTRDKRSFIYDVALTFAGPERPFAEELAKAVRDAGYEVFYDDLYPAQLWGKNLVEFFDRIYRKDSRYCVMFISRE